MKFLLGFLLVPYILSAQVAVIDSNEEQLYVLSAAKTHQFTMDIGGLSISINYAKRMHDYWFWGIGGGGGIDVLNTTVWSSGQLTIELLHAELFARYQRSNYWQIDLGGRISYAGHTTSLMEYGIQDKGSFFGGYTSALVGVRNLKVGVRVIFGHLSNLRNRSKFSVILFPIVRLTIPW